LSILNLQAKRLKIDVGLCWPNHAAVVYAGKFPKVQILANLIQDVGGLRVHGRGPWIEVLMAPFSGCTGQETSPLKFSFADSHFGKSRNPDCRQHS
jgi:hypothetical protein